MPVQQDYAVPPTMALGGEVVLHERGAPAAIP